MTAKVFGWVYSLHHPVTGELRYIGQTTTSLPQRLTGHTCPSSYSQKTHRARWVRGLIHEGLSPTIRVVAQASSQQDLNEKETFWISHHKESGARLTNHAPGGLGGRGPTSPETREKISQAQKGVPRKRHTVETRAKMRASHRGKRYNTLEHLQKLADDKRGVPRPPEVKAKISVAKKGHPSNRKGSQHTASAKDKISESRKGKLTGPQHHQYDHSITTDAILEYLSDGHTKVEAAAHFGKSPTFIHRRLRPLRR